MQAPTRFSSFLQKNKDKAKLIKFVNLAMFEISIITLYNKLALKFFSFTLLV